MSSEAEKASKMNGWVKIMVMVKICFREEGSSWIWFWLAISISGSNQQDSTSNGDEIGSIPVH